MALLLFGHPAGGSKNCQACTLLEELRSLHGFSRDRIKASILILFISVR